MFRRRAGSRAIVLSCLLLLGSAARADITYSLTDHASYQNGWSLSGSITLDGLGSGLDGSHVKSWSYTITQGSTTLSRSSSDGGAFATFSLLKATASELRLGDGGYIAMWASSDAIIYNNGANGYTYAQGYFGYPGSFNRWLAGSPDLSGNSDGWLVGTASVAAVPEPSTALIGSIGMIVGFSMASLRRRRTR